MTRKLFILLSFFLSLSALFFLILTLLSYLFIDIELTTAQAKSLLLDVNGNIIHCFTPRRNSSLDGVPKNLQNAFIAIEDERFFMHPGIDPFGIIRAAVTNLQAREIVAGGSTITQQLAKNAFLTHQRTFSRKIQELILAFRLEKRYQKEEILNHYLNHIYLGHGVYGVGEGAYFYFQKDIQDLRLEEMALLAGITRAPGLYSPLLSLEQALQRRNLVLSKMEELEMIGLSEAEKARESPLNISLHTEEESTAPYFRDRILEEMKEIPGYEEEIRRGLTIYSTLDIQVQDVVEKAIHSFMRKAVDPPQVAVVVLDPQSGEIQALVGGSNYQEHSFNRATEARRQSGSIFKPITFAAALEGGLTPLSSFHSSPTTFITRDGIYRPRNFNANYLYREITLREALRYSDNVVAVKIQEEVTVQRSIDLAERMGIHSPLPQTLSFVLGSGAVTPLEMAQAYSVFANGGFSVPAHGIRKVTKEEGVLFSPKRQKKEVLNKGIAFLITSMLEEVITKGTARRIKGIAPTGAAGKTGTSQHNHDAWFIGYTHSYLTGVWLGYDDPRDLGASGGKLAAPLWAEIMKALDTGASPWRIPQGIESKKICTESRQLAQKDCPETVKEYFLSGSGPLHLCQRHLEEKSLEEILWPQEEEEERRDEEGDEDEEGIEDEEIKQDLKERIRNFFENSLPPKEEPPQEGALNINGSIGTELLAAETADTVF